MARAGFILTDTCVALTLASIVTLSAAGVAAHVSATRASLEPAIHARASGSAGMAWLGDQIRQSGAGLPPDTVDLQHPVTPPLRPVLRAESNGSAGDRLLIRHESRTDCLGGSRVSGQAYVDASREPVVLLQTNAVYVSRSATGGPSLMCDPDSTGPATAQAFVSQIEAMHLRFRLRGSSAWLVTAAVSAWQDVQAVEVCLVLSGGRSASCPGLGGGGPLSPRVLVGVFGLRNAG